MPAVLVSPNKGRQTQSQYGSSSRRRSRSPPQLIVKWQWMDRKDIIKSFSSIFTNHSSNTGMPRRTCTDTSIVRKFKLTHETRPLLFNPMTSLQRHIKQRRDMQAACPHVVIANAQQFPTHNGATCKPLARRNKESQIYVYSTLPTRECQMYVCSALPTRECQTVTGLQQGVQPQSERRQYAHPQPVTTIAN